VRPAALLPLVFLAATLAPMGGCAPGRDLPALPAGELTAYRLGAGDVVRLITFGEEQLTGEFRVADSGTIALPLLGPVPAAGRTPGELEQAVADALRRNGVLRNPSVSAEIVAYRPIFVLGEVNKPGQYPYQPGMTVVTAAAVAGGFTYRAVQGYASVVRTDGGAAIEARAIRQALVQPGDVITVYERRF
jgi:polysaccharide export outer membrane protein